MKHADPPPTSGRLAGLPNAGEVLAGKYRVEAILGVGGMAVVVAARHLELDERVALKILLAKYRSNGEIVARFRREARAAVKIKSKHVARVHDVGTLDDGAPCLVMEYLEGLDLETVLSESGSVPRLQAVDYILQCCEALAEAHGLGIVHRDLKPGNLFVATGADGKPLIKLLDFGISKVTGMGLTRKQASFGTPHYMSPEQLEASDQADHRADIWALGAILHEIITGSPPFDALDLTELQRQVREGEPRRLRDLQPDEPPGLEAAILRCLAKNREERFRDVVEFAQAIAPFGSVGAFELADNVRSVSEAARNRAMVTEIGLERSSAPLAPMSSSDVLRVSTRTSIAIDEEAEPLAPSRRWSILLGAGAAASVLAVVAFLGTRPPSAAPRPAAAPVASSPAAAAQNAVAPAPAASATGSASAAGPAMAGSVAPASAASVAPPGRTSAPRRGGRTPRLPSDRVFDDRK